jgi:POTRA domain, FtsQ-type
VAGDGQRTAPRERAAVAAFPSRSGLRPFRLGQLLPSGRSLAVAFALLAGAAGGYVVARETPLFAVRTIEVHGGSRAVAGQVRRAVEPLVGSSLVSFDGGELERRVHALPIVQSAGYDRAFPHTLRIFVRPEHPLAVVRRGADAWLVSARARVLARVPPRALRGLPRIWVGRATEVLVGARVGGTAGWAAHRLGLLRGTGFLARVRTARAEAGALTLVLRSGTELRLGTAADPRLQAAIAGKVLASLPSDARPSYLDLTLPERPVVGPQRLTRR